MEGDSESASVNVELSTSTDRQDELVNSLTSLLQLYGQDEHLHSSSEHLALTAAQVAEVQEEFSNKKFMSGVIGRVVGTSCGAFGGAVMGLLGAGGGALFNENISTVGASLGLLGGMFGGAVGGAFSGAAAGAAVEEAPSPGHGVVCNVACYAIGLVTGSAIGGIFGGNVGAVGGALGGTSAALWTTRFVGAITRSIIDHRSKFSGEQKNATLKQKNEHVTATFQPLVEELKVVLEARRRSKVVTEELKTTKEEMNSFS